LPGDPTGLPVVWVVRVALFPCVAVVLVAEVLGCWTTGAVEFLGVEFCVCLELGFSLTGDGATVFTGAASGDSVGAGGAAR
jgi:hypothetical protein